MRVRVLLTRGECPLLDVPRSLDARREVAPLTRKLGVTLGYLLPHGKGSLVLVHVGLPGPWMTVPAPGPTADRLVLVSATQVGGRVRP